MKFTKAVMDSVLESEWPRNKLKKRENIRTSLVAE